MDALEIIAVSVGNTRTRVGLFRGDQLDNAAALPSDQPAQVAAAILGAPAKNPAAPVVIASVNEPATERLVDELIPDILRRDGQIYRFGRDLAVPVPMAVRDEAGVGHDRLLNALGAYSRAQQACVVIDAGTAVTVDFVDGQGVFQGGAIGPGLNMMLQSLHEKTAALPLLRIDAANSAGAGAGTGAGTGPGTGSDASAPAPAPFGKDTAEAMRLGVQAAVRGMVRYLIERYAESYGAYPQIIATGGDARLLFENDDLIEHIVPDLTLIGIQAACARQLAPDLDEE